MATAAKPRIRGRAAARSPRKPRPSETARREAQRAAAQGAGAEKPAADNGDIKKAAENMADIARRMIPDAGSLKSALDQIERVEAMRLERARLESNQNARISDGGERRLAEGAVAETGRGVVVAAPRAVTATDAPKSVGHLEAFGGKLRAHNSALQVAVERVRGLKARALGVGPVDQKKSDGANGPGAAWELNNALDEQYTLVNLLHAELDTLDSL